jgi:hypothetical protein
MRQPLGIGFLRRGARPPVATLVVYIDDHKQVLSVEPICRVLTEHGMPIAPSIYYEARIRAPSRHAVRDEQLRTEVARVHQANYGVYGPARSGCNSTGRTSRSRTAPFAG